MDGRKKERSGRFKARAWVQKYISIIILETDYINLWLNCINSYEFTWRQTRKFSVLIPRGIFSIRKKGWRYGMEITILSDYGQIMYVIYMQMQVSLLTKLKRNSHYFVDCDSIVCNAPRSSSMRTENTKSYHILWKWNIVWSLMLMMLIYDRDEWYTKG